MMGSGKVKVELITDKRAKHDRRAKHRQEGQQESKTLTNKWL